MIRMQEKRMMKQKRRLYSKEEEEEASIKNEDCGERCERQGCKKT